MQLEQLIKTLRALTDPTRLLLLSALAKDEFAVSELTEMMDMGQSRVSRHLKILAECQLVSIRKKGTWAYYHCPDPLPEPYRQLVEEASRLADASDEYAALAVRMANCRLRHSGHSRAFFDQVATDWDSLLAPYLPPGFYSDILPGFIAGGEVIVDLGVGTGCLLEHLCGAQLIGVDSSPQMLEVASRRLSGRDEIDLRLGEFAHLPLADNQADVAILCLVLHHVADRHQEIICEVRRILKQTGRCLIVDYLPHQEEWMHQRFYDHHLGLDPDSVQATLVESGFVVEKVEQVACPQKNLGIFVISAKLS